jgi:uncharacterized protein (TIGR02996 family)
MNAADGAALIRAILEDPADDLPRLAWCDWFDEQEGIGDYARVESSRAVRLGLRFHRYPYRAVIDGVTWIRQRGFVFRVELTVGDFLERAESLFREHPITEVRLTCRKPSEGLLNTVRDFSSTNRRVFSWLSTDDDSDWREHRYPGSDRLIPSVIADHFKGQRGENPRWVNYDSAGEAFADLSHGCVAYGRRLAGLPDLTAPHPNPDTRL